MDLSSLQGLAAQFCSFEEYGFFVNLVRKAGYSVFSARLLLSILTPSCKHITHYHNALTLNHTRLFFTF